MNVELSVEFLAGLTGQQPGELSEALKKDKDSEELKSPEEIQAIIGGYVKDKLAKNRKEAQDEGHGRGTREALTAKEKELAEKWGVDYEKGKSIQDLAAAWAEKTYKSEKSGKKEELTPEKIKAHEVYVNDMKAQMAKYQELDDQFKAFKADAERQQVLHTVKTKAQSVLQANKFAFPENQKIRENALSGFVQDLTSDRNFKIDGDKILPLDKDGNPVRNELLNEVSFDDLVVDTAKGWFEVTKDDGRNSPGAASQGGGAAPGGSGLPVVKNASEFFSEMSKLDSLEKKQAFKQQYEKQLASGEW